MLQKRNLLIAVATTLLVTLIAVFGFSAVRAQGTAIPNCPYGNFMMGNQAMMGGMMGSGTMNGMMGQQYSSGQCAQMYNMMGGQTGFMRMMGNAVNTRFGPGIGMMGQWTPPADLRPTADKPLTLKSATTIAEAYIAAWKSIHILKLGDLMQFSNLFYGQALETDTEYGAFEFIIDPQTGIVYAEPGPAMMWNLHYGAATWVPQNADGVFTVTPDKAREYAQAFLDDKLPGTKIADTLTKFYGYYTLSILKDGKTTDLLSVNGFTGQVWYHAWLGDFVSQVE